MRLRIVLLFAALFISACGSDAPASNANPTGSADSSTSTVEAATSSIRPEAVPADASELPAALALEDENPLCVQIDEMLDSMLKSELGSASAYSDFELLLPPELRGGQATTGPLPVAAARAEAQSVDAHTTEQCGVAFVQSSIHITITCSTDRSSSDLAQFIPDWGPCSDPRLEQSSVVSLDEQMDALDILEQAIREKFEDNSGD